MNAQSKATAKYQTRKGLIPKSYKLPADLVDAFAEACEENEISQSAQLTEFMRGYCERAGVKESREMNSKPENQG